MPRAKGNGVELEYSVHGAGHSKSILLINGLGSPMTRWPASFCLFLADYGFQVVRFDNRDVGKSTWLTDNDRYTLQDMAGDAISVLKAARVERAHVAGISMGGEIAQTIASDHPEFVQSLTSIMSTTGNPDLSPEKSDLWPMMMQPSPDPRDRKAYLDHAVDHALALGSPAYPWPAGALRRRAEHELLRGFNPSGVSRQLNAARASGDRRLKVTTIKAPTVVLHGTDDPLMPLAAGLETASLIPDAEFRQVPGMGHDLPPALHGIVAQAILRAAARSRFPLEFTEDAPRGVWREWL